MKTLSTDHATVHCHSDFSVIKITLNNPDQPLDLMDIKAIYAAFFKDHLLRTIEGLKDDDLIKLGYYVAKEFPYA